MRNTKRMLATLLALVMMLSTMSSLALAESGAKWTETATADGWIKVENEGGATLGYSPDSGVTIIEADGFAFKDLNRNGTLDVYEDWRLDANARAQDLAFQLEIDSILGLMLHHSLFVINDDAEDGLVYGDDGFYSFKEALDEGIRVALSFAETSPNVTQARFSNSMQAYVEGLPYGIPVNITTNGREFTGWPSRLALAATFDSEFVHSIGVEQARQYRALGLSTVLDPQIDLATEPRWSRVAGTFGEDPALSRDMADAVISGLQSTYDENGNDLGWGADSVLASMKHWPGDGPGEGGREAHSDDGKYNVYPGDAFETQLIPFVDGGLNLSSATEQAASVMTSYSIAYSEDETYGELVGSGFSEYKVQLLRQTYGYDGLIVTDFGVTLAEESGYAKPWGVEELSRAERAAKALKAGVDQLGGEYDIAVIHEAYSILEADMGADAAQERIRDSARRILRGVMQIGLFDNPYVVSADAEKIVNGDETTAMANEAQQRSIVMLKNTDGTIKEAVETDEKPTVYIPMKYDVNYLTWSLPVDMYDANQHFTVVTDTLGEATGPEGNDGQPTHAIADLTRASAEELAACDFALVIVSSPLSSGAITETGDYLPISLQYGEYTALSSGVRSESISGDVIETFQDGVYGPMRILGKENRSYYGASTVSSNLSDFEGIQYAIQNLPESAKIIVAVNASNPMVFSEFESDVDAILYGFFLSKNDVFLDIVAGQVEPSGLLPMQMPANMETVEAQYEDVPRDMECYVDSAGNTYDFAFGLNWSGVINDERVAKYAVPPLTELAAQPVQ